MNIPISEKQKISYGRTGYSSPILFELFNLWAEEYVEVNELSSITLQEIKKLFTHYYEQVEKNEDLEYAKPTSMNINMLVQRLYCKEIEEEKILITVKPKIRFFGLGLKRSIVLLNHKK